MYANMLDMIRLCVNEMPRNTLSFSRWPNVFTTAKIVPSDLFSSGCVSL